MDYLSQLVYIFIHNVVKPMVVFAEKHDLDEALARKSRHPVNPWNGTNTFFKGLGASTDPTYFWQPETLMFKDEVTQAEVWRLTYFPGNSDYHSKEYSVNAWSHDGSRLGFYNSNRQRISTDPSVSTSDYRWLVKTDGTMLRKARGGGRNITSAGFCWMSTELAYLFTPDGSELGGASQNNIYKYEIDPATNGSKNSPANTLLQTATGGSGRKETPKDAVTSTDSYFVFQDDNALYWPTPSSEPSRKLWFLKLSDNSITGWGSARKFGPSTGHLVNGTDGATVYRCIQSHVSMTDDRPTTGVNWATYWTASSASPYGRVMDWASGRNYSATPYADPYGMDSHGVSSLYSESNLRPSSSAVINPNADYVLLHFSNFSIHFMTKRSGSWGDGGPQWEDWNGSTFGTNEEIRAWMSNPNTKNWNSPVTDQSTTPHNPYGNGYGGHWAFDRWGHYGLVSVSQDCNTPYVDWGSPGTKSCPGKYIIDLQNNAKNPSWVDASNSNVPLFYNNYVGGHQSYWSFTDWIVAAPYDAATAALFKNLYNKTAQTGKSNYQAPVQLNKIYTAAYVGCSNYNIYIRPSQSPDGTKVMYHNAMFNTNFDGSGDCWEGIGLEYVVSEYPHPPEIFAVNAAGGTVSVSADWGNTSGTWRGYTQRKWVDETTGTYLPPREINEWRLWRSADKSTWTPVGVVTANAWDRYNFKTGAWTGNTYWTITDAPGTGTWYYGLTSIEHSGLESRKISNIFIITIDGGGSGTGSEDTNYAGSPTGFYTTLPEKPPMLSYEHKKSPATADGQYTLTWTEPGSASMVRYYNVYALDGSDPQSIQQRRIASIPRDICVSGSCSWVDWLGNQDASTQYGVTTVDTHGNESEIRHLGGGPPPPNPQYSGVISLGSGGSIGIGSGGEVTL